MSAGLQGAIRKLIKETVYESSEIKVAFKATTEKGLLCFKNQQSFR